MDTIKKAITIIDRSNSGKVDFQKEFADKHTAPRPTQSADLNLMLIIDDASIELFADNGVSVMTEIFFPDQKFSEITINSKNGLTIENLQFTRLKSIYR